MKFFLIGETLKHSFSKPIHEKLSDINYNLKQLKPCELEAFMQQKDFDGLNVTIPYKQEVMKYLDEISINAKKIGSVNTVIKQKDGKLFGDNTDFFGLEYIIKKLDVDLCGKKVVILGSGGTSLTAKAVVTSLGGLPVVVSRTGQNNYKNLDLHSDASVIVNTTPVGMFPSSDVSPVELDLFENLLAVVDVVYNPLVTKLCYEVKQMDIKQTGGLAMLVAQAAKANEMFKGNCGQVERIDEITVEIKKQKQNIVLIGMPGCGKTTIGKLLAKELSRTHVDIDDEITKKFGLSPKEIIEKQGEERFRQCETEVIKEISCQNSLVISTGGGVVTKTRNKFYLKQNGLIFFLDRETKNLETTGRPLSNADGVQKLYEQRYPKYIDFSDFVVQKNEQAEKRVEQIITRFSV